MRQRQKLLLILFGFIVAFLFLEAMLSLSGKIYYSYRLKNKRLNNRAVRILCIGDSFTFGAGAIKGYSYPEQLQILLDEDQGREFIVYNCGMPGTNSSQHFKILKDSIDVYNPNVILIMSGDNNRFYLAQSNYFLFKENSMEVYFYRTDAFLSQLRSYKLLKTLILSLRSKALAKVTKSKCGNLENNKLEKNITQLDESKQRELDEHLNLGRQYLDNRLFSYAIEEFKKVLEINPEHNSAFINLSDIYACQGRYDLAEKYLRKAILINPYSEPAHEILWQVYWRTGRNRLALETVKRMVEIDPLNESARQILKRGLPPINNKNILDKMLVYDSEHMFKLARSRGAEIILQSYPFAKDEDKIRRSLADKWNIFYVDNAARFDELKCNKDYKREDYFVEDSHCNANGYRIIAENVYKVLKTEVIK